MFNLFRKSKPSTYTNVSAQEFKSLMEEKKDAFVLDVRTAGEVAAGKIKGAKNVDIMQSNFVKQLETLDKSKTYLLYCRSGSRSAQAADKMAAIGFGKLYNLKGGIASWPYEQV